MPKNASISNDLGGGMGTCVHVILFFWSEVCTTQFCPIFGYTLEESRGYLSIKKNSAPFSPILKMKTAASPEKQVNNLPNYLMSQPSKAFNILAMRTSHLIHFHNFMSTVIKHSSTFQSNFILPSSVLLTLTIPKQNFLLVSSIAM